MRRLSIRWHLTLWYGAVLAAALAVFGAAVYLMMRHVLYGQVAQGLLMEMGEVGEEVSRAPDADAMRTWLNRRFTKHPGYDIQATGPGGEPLLRSERIRDRGLPLPHPLPLARQAVISRLAGPEGQPRYLASRVVRGPAGPVVLQVAGSLAAVDHELGELLAVLLLAGPLALACALAGGYLLARTALAPVDRMAQTAEEITASRLDRRLEAPNPDDELGRLARTLNKMIARLERSFEEIQSFTADAAHELRTPLAVMRNVAEVTLGQPRSPEEHRRVLEDMLEEIERLTRLAEQLLFLCRGDAGLMPVVPEPIRLDELVRDVGDQMRVVAEEKGLLLNSGVMAPVHVAGDADQLRRLLFNLFDNAIKYTPSGGTVTSKVEQHDGQARATVADSGIGIPPEHLSRVFDRFYRADPARTREDGGTGLGLAISRSIAEAHGGGLRIESDVGRGTRAILTMPGRPCR